jgi:hypothetical protein
MAALRSILRILRVLAISSIVVFSIVSGTQAPSQAHALGESLTLIRSGSVMTDSLRTGDVSAWTFMGDAPRERAPYSFNEDTQGLHISIQAASAGQWAGYFAKSPNTHARVFHALISLGYASIPSGNFNTGLYVQTGNSVSYVSCAADVTPKGYYWLVNYAVGSQSTATEIHRLFTQVGGGLTRDCTIMTDGTNLLTVYLDGQRVYSNESMGLRMPQPFNAFLEVQSTCTSQMLTGTYSDFYETTGATVMVRGVPPGDTAEIFASGSGSAVAIGSSGPDGIVSLDVSAQRTPIQGIVQVNGVDDGSMVSTGNAKIWGGDFYRLDPGRQW